MRILTAAFMLLTSAALAQAGEITSKPAAQEETAAAATVEAVEETAVTPAPQAETKSMPSLGKVGREGCGHFAQAKTPPLTN